MVSGIWPCHPVLANEIERERVSTLTEGNCSAWSCGSYFVTRWEAEEEHKDGDPDEQMDQPWAAHLPTFCSRTQFHVLTISSTIIPVFLLRTAECTQPDRAHFVDAKLAKFTQ